MIFYSNKSLTLGKNETTTGEVVNLMSVDTQRLVDMMPYINMLWSSPLQIAIALYFLWQTLGASVLSGFLVMVLLIPINGAIAAKSRQFQVQQMKQKDIRVKSMNEILQGIKVSKPFSIKLLQVTTLQVESQLMIFPSSWNQFVILFNFNLFLHF